VNLKVLIVDKSETDAELAVRELSKSGFSVTWERVETASALRDALLRPWDLVVSDSSMLRALALTHDGSAAAARLASARLLAAQEAERRRIARALHDELGQLLTALQLTLRAALERQGGVETAITEALALADQAVQQTRDFSVDLCPVILDDLGLPPALRWLAERHERWTGIAVEEEIQPIGRLDPAIESAAFRVAQEALTNIARHANARRVAIALRADETALVLEVRDDGRGFDVTAAFDGARKGLSLGIAGMRERALAAGGTLEIASDARRGTVVCAAFPVSLEVKRVARPRRPRR
jgi:signal transduction histidine kinase